MSGRSLLATTVSVLLLLLLLSTPSHQQILEQPVMTLTEDPSKVMLSVVAYNFTENSTISPELILVDQSAHSARSYIPHVVTNYSKTIEKVYLYNKTGMFYLVDVVPGRYYSWSVHAEGYMIGPHDFIIRDYAENKTSKFIVVADFDNSPTAAATLKALARQDWQQIDAFIHAGDFAYDVDYNGGKVGDAYFNCLSSIITATPYLVIAGNHENYDNAALFNYRFRMANYDDRFENNVYAVVKNNVLFTFVNYDWFLKIHRKRKEETLAKVVELFEKYKTDERVRWRVVVTHRPIYCGWSTKKDCRINFYELKPFEDVYRRYSVDVFLLAHEHIYERLKFMHNFQYVSGLQVSSTADNIFEVVDSTEPLTVISGLAGNKEEFPLDPETFATNDVAFGGIQSFLEVTVTDRYFSVRSVSAVDGRTLDHVRLIKTSHFGPKSWLSTVPTIVYPIVFILIVLACFLLTQHLIQKKKQTGKGQIDEDDLGYSKVKAKQHDGLNTSGENLPSGSFVIAEQETKI